MEELLSRDLGDPTHDPHGDPIPTKAGALARVEGVALGQLEKGKPAVVARVSDRSPEKLRYLVSLGLLPGARVTLLQRAPFHGPLTLRVGSRRCALDAGLAELVVVRAASRRGSRTSAAAPRAAAHTHAAPKPKPPRKRR
jgi:DtxR family Mn-dependent transcriptional regulator